MGTSIVEIERNSVHDFTLLTWGKFHKIVLGINRPHTLLIEIALFIHKKKIKKVLNFLLKNT